MGLTTGNDIIEFIEKYNLYDTPLYMIIPINSRRARICFNLDTVKNPSDGISYSTGAAFLTLKATNECNSTHEPSASLDTVYRERM